MGHVCSVVSAEPLKSKERGKQFHRGTLGVAHFVQREHEGLNFCFAAPDDMLDA